MLVILQDDLGLLIITYGELLTIVYKSTCRGPTHHFVLYRHSFVYEFTYRKLQQKLHTYFKKKKQTFIDKKLIVMINTRVKRKSYASEMEYEIQDSPLVLV